MPTLTRPDSCPDCTAPLDTDPTFPAWCPACEWNLLARPAAPSLLTPREQRREDRAGRRTAKREQAVRTRAELVYEQVASDTPAHRDPAVRLAAALAGLVHLTTLLLLAGSVALVVSGPWPLRVLGAVGLVVAVVLRPRLGRLTEDAAPVERADAPALYALADRVATAVGAAPVDVILLTDEFNAAFARIGVRNRGVLMIGLPLWAVLTPGQRVAVLAHEFGHDVNGDHRRGRWLGSALRALHEWYRLTLPERLTSAEDHFVLVLAGMVQRLVMRVLNGAVAVLLVALDRLTARSGQAAEYRADALSAKVAGTATARSMLETLLLGSTVESVLLRRRNRPVRARGTDHRAAAAELWTELAESVAAVPRGARAPAEAVRPGARLGRPRAPPTHLRIRLVGQRPPVTEPLVALADEEAAAIEAELAPHGEKLARELLRS